MLGVVAGLQVSGCLDVDEAKQKFCGDHPARCDGGSLESGWHVMERMQESRAFHTATRLNDGRVLVVGGVSANWNAAVASTEIYDPKTNKWTSAGTLPEPRARHTATLLNSGKVLVVGGHDASGTELTKVLEYDPTGSGSWSVAGALSQGRFNHDAVLLTSTSTGEVLVMGGGVRGGIDGLTSAELYNPVSRGWTSVSSGTLEKGREGVVAVEMSGNRVLAVGGFPSSPRTAEVYQRTNGTWSLVSATAAQSRVGHTVTRLTGGDILVAGADLNNNSYGASTELFSETTLSWRSAGSLSEPRAYFTATRLDSGDVLVTGGSRGENQSLKVVQLYRPTGGGWTAGPPMAVERAFHRATLLNSGQVLVTGGFRNTEPYALDSVELYVP